jgi:hypothetical protein
MRFQEDLRIYFIYLSVHMSIAPLLALGLRRPGGGGLDI